MDIISDVIYLTDGYIQSKKGYYENGLMITDGDDLRKRYFSSERFVWDVLSVIPTEILHAFSFTNMNAAVRLNRLLKVKSFLEFHELSKKNIRQPQIFQIAFIVLGILIIIHWNACIYYIISKYIGFGADVWVYPDEIENDSLIDEYMYCFYWAVLILTNRSKVPPPETNFEIFFMTVNFIAGLCMIATIVGNVGTIVSNMKANRSQFQTCINKLKLYLKRQKVKPEFEEKIMNWFNYLQENKYAVDDSKIFAGVPEQVRAEISLHTYLETIRKVPLFADSEIGFLKDLAAKLKMQVYNPGDYVCRKKEVGREMYIVKQGTLCVVSDDGITVLAQLKQGAVIGELSMLNIPGSKTGNRRTANVKSLGYSDLLSLSKKDLWSVLADYPEVKEKLIAKGKSILKKDNLLDENIEESKIDLSDEEAIDNEVQNLLTNLECLTSKYQNFVKYFNTRTNELHKSLRCIENSVKWTSSQSHV